MVRENGSIQYFVKELYDDVKASDSVKYRSKQFLENHPQKVKGIVKKWHNQFSADDIIAMYDESIFENGLDGMIFTEKGVAWDYAFDKIYVPFTAIEQVEIHYGMMKLNGMFDEELVVDYKGKDGDIHHASTSNVYYKPNKLKTLFECLREYTNNGVMMESKDSDEDKEEISDHEEDRNPNKEHEYEVKDEKELQKQGILNISESLTEGINIKIVDCWPDYDGVKYFTAYNGDEMWTEVGVESGLIKKNIDIRSNPAGAWTEMLISFGMSKRIFYQGDQASYQSVKSFFDENYGDRGIEVMYEDCGSLPEKENNREKIIKDAIDGIVEVAENLSDGINLKIIDCWPDYDGVKYLSAHEGDQLWKELGEESGLIKKSIDIRKSPAEAWTEILISFGVCKSIYYMGEETECLKLKEFFDSNYGDLGISISYLGGATWEL